MTVIASRQLTLLWDVGLSICVSFSNTARPLQALGCCSLSAFIPHMVHGELADLLMRNSSGKCKAHFSVTLSPGLQPIKSCHLDYFLIPSNSSPFTFYVAFIVLREVIQILVIPS